MIIEVKNFDFEVINREAVLDPTMRVGCLPCGDEDSDAASAYSEPLAAQIRYVVNDFHVCAPGAVFEVVLLPCAFMLDRPQSYIFCINPCTPRCLSTCVDGHGVFRSPTG